MYCDLPFIKRCCFCLPLRPSLIAWVYFKMIGVMMLIVLLSLILSEEIKIPCGPYRTCIVTYWLVLLLLVIDELFGIIFLRAAHKKNSKLMQLCFYYNVFLFVASNVVMILYMTANDYINTLSAINGEELLIALIILILNFVLQFYIILAIRSQIIKLNNEGSVTFNKDEGNTYCTMTRNTNKVLSPLPQLQDLHQLTNHVHSEPSYDYCYIDTVHLNKF